MNYIGAAPEMIILIIGLLVIAIIKRSYVYGIIALLVLFAILYFYRGANLPDLYPNTIISPADGQILKIVKHGDVYQVAIFLNIHNIHVQYAPIDGNIVSMKYKPGTFNAAYLFEKSQYNERLETIMDTKVGRVMVVQLAGLIARTIVPFKEIGNNLKQGEPMGLIKFGSRVDLWIPSSTKLRIKDGERIKIGEIIATY
jgi:phosphatidylserine decarboxylase